MLGRAAEGVGAVAVVATVLACGQSDANTGSTELCRSDAGCTASGGSDAGAGGSSAIGGSAGSTGTGGLAGGGGSAGAGGLASAGGSAGAGGLAGAGNASGTGGASTGGTGGSSGDAGSDLDAASDAACNPLHGDDAGASCSLDLCTTPDGYEIRVTSDSGWYVGALDWTLGVCSSTFSQYTYPNGSLQTLAFPVTEAEFAALPKDAHVYVHYGPLPAPAGPLDADCGTLESRLMLPQPIEACGG